MLLGLIKVFLILWITKTIFTWYTRMVARRRPNPAESPLRPGSEPMHSGRIEDAEFEEIDSGNDQSR